MQKKKKKIDILIVPQHGNATDVIFPDTITMHDIEVIEKALILLKRKKYIEGTSKLMEEIRHA